MHHLRALGLLMCPREVAVASYRLKWNGASSQGRGCVNGFLQFYAMQAKTWHGTDRDSAPLSAVMNQGHEGPGKPPERPARSCSDSSHVFQFPCIDAIYFHKL